MKSLYDFCKDFYIIKETERAVLIVLTVELRPPCSTGIAALPTKEVEQWFPKVALYKGHLVKDWFLDKLSKEIFDTHLPKEEWERIRFEEQKGLISRFLD